ncbi:MAG: diguanylate cyclase [Clostridia bacterium]|nr:diguanylate cyclase [Clostridia bacterium]
MDGLFNFDNKESTREVLGEYIDNLLASYWDETLSGNMQSIFFNTSSSDMFSFHMAKFINNIGNEAMILRHKLQKHDFCEPYFPFLDFIKKYLSNNEINNIEKFLEDSNVYYYQRSVFLSYYVNGISKRYEELILDELEYEKERMLESIKKQFFLLSESTPLIIVIEDLHYSQESALRLIKQFIEKNYDNKILLVFSLNEDGINNFDEPNSYWEEFLEFVKINNSIFDFRTNSEEQINYDTENLTPHYDIEELINLSNNCLNFLALDECKQYSLNIFNELHLNNKVLSEDYQLLLLHTLGDVHNFLAENDVALIHYHSLLNFAQNTKNVKEISDAYRKISYIHFKKDTLKTAERFCNQSIKLAEEINHRLQILKAYFLLFLIEEKARNHTEEQWNVMAKNIIEIGIELDMKNTLSFFCTNPYGLFGIFAKAYYDENKPFHLHGINIAQKYNNTFRLAIAYHTMGMVHSVRGEYDNVLNYLRKSEKLKLQLGNKRELAHIYNGFGYHYFTIGDYKNAHKCYGKALYYLKAIDDYHEFCLTLYNIALNFFLAFEHKLSAQYLEKVILIMSMLKNESLKYHSLCSIYTMIGISYYKCGQPNKTLEYFTKIKILNLQPFKDKNEDYFMLELIQAFLCKQDKKYSEADAHFQKASVYLHDQEHDSIKFLGPRYYYEYAVMCKELNQLDKANKIFNEGIKYCEELGYGFYKEILLNELSGNKDCIKIKKLNISKDVIDFESTIKAVKTEVNLTKLHKKVNDMNFLNNLQNILSKESHRLDLIKSAMELINNSFIVELSIFSIKKGSAWKVLYGNKNIDELKFDIVGLISTLSKGYNEKLISDVSKTTSVKEFAGSLNSIISLPLFSEGRLVGNIFCATIKKELVLTSSELQVLSIATKQLSTSLEKIRNQKEIVQKNKLLNEFNSRLIKSATTDMLTGLYNRQVLHKKLEEEQNRMRRYSDKNQSGFSILFIDLDNFKYYNDTFGHRIGDLILYMFADILKKVTRENDFVVRYGGDEFIIVLPEVGLQDASDVAKRILSKLANQDYFQQDIESFLNRSVEIPEKYRLSCSIGISEYNLNANYNDTDAIIQDADKALYYAKTLGKNQYKSLNEVPEDFFN